MTNTKRQHIVEAPPKQVITLEKATACSAVGDKEEINWLHTSLLTITPTIALIGMYLGFVPKWQTVVFSVIMYFWTGLGITAGYHRLWSHRAYDAHPIVRWALCIGGAGAFEGSAKWWCRNHRAHHRYTDTNKDPYNARRGFFYAHLGWMLVKQNIKKIGWADITDLQKDPMIMFQHKYYGFVSIGFGIVFPSVVCALWGDFWCGYFYAAMLRIVVVHHATFCVNSLAHWWGEKSFSDHHTAFDSLITAIFTFGEGYHNYHHEFPVDYRNGIKFYHYDPTKWLIGFLSFFGMTYNLKQISTEEIAKARVQMAQRKIDHEAAKIKYGRQFNSLPDMPMSEFKMRCDRGESLVIVNDVIHDVTKFVHEHPGGRQTLLDFVGQDVTALFRGDEGEHAHSKNALEFLALLRIANVKREAF